MEKVSFEPGMKQYLLIKYTFLKRCFKRQCRDTFEMWFDLPYGLIANLLLILVIKDFLIGQHLMKLWAGVAYGVLLHSSHG